VATKAKTAERLQPGDIWRHKGMGTLYVTSEDMDQHPGFLKCYWRMSGKDGLRSFMDPTRTEHLTLVERWGEQDENGEWHLKK
jgi:hypothetical protein